MIKKFFWLVVTGVLLILLFCFAQRVIGTWAKYVLLVLSTIFGFAADITEDINLKYLKLTFKAFAAICLIFGIVFVINDDKQNATNFQNVFNSFDSLYCAAKKQEETDAKRFSVNLERIESVHKSLEYFQVRLSNPLPDSMILVFTLGFDLSKSPLHNFMPTSKTRFQKEPISGDTTAIVPIDSIGEIKAKNDVAKIREYFSETYNTILVRFKKGDLVCTYEVDYGGYSFTDYLGNEPVPITKVRVNQRKQILFPYNFEPGFNEVNLPFLKMKKFGTSNFISVMDFQDADVEFIFGYPKYDR